MPSLAIKERKGYSLPKNQTPRVWPGKSSGDSMPLSLRQVSIMPDFSNTWAMFTSGTPFSRDARAEGIQSTMTRSEEHTSELQSLMRISYAVFCLKKKNNKVVHSIIKEYNKKKSK